ncbi:MPN499 family protein [Mesomycoplasma ovipneumoniae]|uniref:MPN499 family protein n=1 Tax=Mesomycoplasma ovipneumoniae TaxID=29562 RepID=UPI00311ACA59
MNNIRQKISNFNKVKVNHLSDGYWLVPSFFKIFSPKLTGYVIKKAKTLEELVNFNDFQKKEIIFNFNGDHNFYNFNILMKLRQIDFRLDIKAVLKKPDDAIFIFFPVQNCKIVLDKQSLKLIYDGIIPFFSKEYYSNLVFYQREKSAKLQNNDVFKGFFWRRNGFEEIYVKSDS